MPPLGPLSARHITVGLSPMTAQTRAVMYLSDLGRCPGMQSLWLSDECLLSLVGYSALKIPGLWDLIKTHWAQALFRDPP